MRVPDSATRLSILRDLEIRQAAVAESQRRLVTGRRVETVSDDPVAGSQIMRLDAALRDVARYRRNAAWATTRMAAEDTALTTARDILRQAKDLALTGAAASPTDPVRQAALAQVTQLREEMLSLANLRIGNEYIFGGAETGQPPFLANGTYIGDTVVREVQLDDGVTLPTNHTGNQVFAPALQALDGLIQELASGTPATIQAQGAALGAAQDQALAAQAELGGRLAEIERVGEALARREGQMLDRRDAVRDADPAEAAVQAVAAQSALERAYAAISRILSTRLTDFLR
ncbi:MAG TPA: flagellar hook-associated protein FlgL [Gemmatimonadales bacterium]|jgi:flagellar hook-associated protein 3 FlgL|nr:flagellar hook-associated protein FlgL [Gemmatimonadales bacterium]